MLYELTIKSASEKLASGEISSVELTESILERIKAVDSKVGAYITVCEKEALGMARASDERRKSGKILSEIDGIPIAVKDLYLTKGIRTTAASKILDDFIPPYESTVTAHLWAAGAVLIGKTNLDQFAMGSSTETSAYNTATEYDSTTRNPWDLERIPGGSSGGSAAAVAADLCIAAVGTDTGGSIRQPASLCSITGLKPTYGRVSRYGIMAMASSLDQAGPMTKTVEDAAILLKYMSGHDKHDSTSSKREVPEYSSGLGTRDLQLKVGVPKEFFGAGLDPEVDKIIREAIDKYREMGAEIVDVSLPLIKYALAVYYILMPVEVSSNLARYDGIRYGYSVLKHQTPRNNNQTLDEVYSISRAEGFGAEAKRRIMLGSYVSSAGYADAYYKKALKVRTLIKNEFDRIFEKVDLLIAPVAPSPAFKFGEKTADPLSMYLSDVLTVPINPAGLPAMSLPAGFTKENLPVGLQLIGPMWGEQTILNTGHAFQQVTNHHLQKPKIK
ncbi:Asp-tRNA(Asn)/Glu-tRNA(Gln) amidotransferase GatCAB subunit A [Candidatus Berkelbacteria bacterium CG10_big_fil_rev_8_21_14_0_10_43_13]|uniref:Glutamyl-tRNA(Gln) amidotransferase subunit A n=1 Tax=Candidatus Berkelbacteria bacterium CG10_big_fil_rev_8_21_14_0_10_43_13 TaxID=1974514 RepID=A0A2H0W5N4_9BACT|nr:MAG: Asp-tRNA(Asn)/Glu-tRNA(Gln) amidotransferase GatCAB subunit A [Candidatus Berkelbacteria bacterium CG10_big_fil_rev_8_21_14_0_10_43_13]